MAPAPFFISVSRLGRWKECPRRYFLERRWEPTVGSTALILGSAYHKFLETFHGPGDASREDRLADGLDAFEDELAAKSGSLLDTLVFDGEAIEMSDADSFEAAKARGLLRAYAAHEAVRIDGRLGVLLGVEREFPARTEVPEADADEEYRGKFVRYDRDELGSLTLGIDDDGTPIILRGIWDGDRYDDDGARGVVEHKSTGDMQSIAQSNLLLDEQISAMCSAASRLWGHPCTSAAYNVLVKPRHKPRKNETPYEFEYRVQETVQLEPAKYFKRYVAKRSPAFIAAWEQETFEVCKLIRRGVQWGRNKATWGGPCGSCMFVDACAVWHDEKRREDVLKTMCVEVGK